MFAFFGFNGTAGVWRISSVKEAGGWEDRTTVEAMDLAVRVGLKGWKFIYVGDVKARALDYFHISPSTASVDVWGSKFIPQDWKRDYAD